jgi:DNA-binding beta-propeller fold protein YncE
MIVRKRIFLFLFSSLVGAVALALVLAWAVGAQGPEPYERELYRGSHPIHPTGARLDEKPAPRPALSGDLEAQDVSAAVALGEPGLSFRYEDTFGVTEVPYASTTTHLNRPYALAVDGTDNVYVAEGEGHRVLKYDSAGNYQNLQIGYTGLCRVWDEEDTGLCGPGGLAVDSGGNIWVAERWPNRVSIFMPTGTYSGQLGVTWEWGSDDEHFGGPEGVAFDSAGRIYVADKDNDRVQIFDSSRTYSATIGGTCGTGNNQLCQPHGLAMGSGDVLYVADSDNARVQVYQLVGGSMVFSQSITTTGTTDFGWVPDVAADANYLYVADHWNYGQVHVFSQSGVYSSTIGGDCGGSNDWFCWPMDVAVDSAGNVYVADTWAHSRVMKCSGGPTWTCTPFAGTKDVPYPTDNNHFNGPAGIAVGASLFVVEENGQRLLKLNDSGVTQWTVGEAGVWGSDNDHFDWPGGVAVDSNGRIYVADDNNHRVQIFNSEVLVIVGAIIIGSIKRLRTCPRLHTLPVLSVGHLILVNVESAQIDGVRRVLVTVST